MEPLDPKAELMRLADEYAQWYKPSRPLLPVARATLEAAISQALTDARRLALEEAAKVCDSHECGGDDDFVCRGLNCASICAGMVRKLVGGKDGGT